MQEFSKSKINDLGKRLRKNDGHTHEDMALLNAYRNSFGEALEIVKQTLIELGAAPTERSKSTLSIVQKLRREKTLPLATMQDIAGCRVIVLDLIQQDTFVESLKTSFEDVRIKDRREKPSHGYRAVHVIPKVAGKSVEIQVRTFLQHLWAQLSEKAADVSGDTSIKYGGGAEEYRELLDSMSNEIYSFELDEAQVFDPSAYIAENTEITPDELKQFLYDFPNRIRISRDKRVTITNKLSILFAFSDVQGENVP